MSKYQIMPALSDEQYEALKADIATAGVRVPIEVDENGDVIDGHHRRAIAMELGIECPETVIRGLEEFEKLDRAFVLNATRRHFNRDQQRAVIVKSLMLHPRLADREHARRCGVSHPTVADVRRALEAAGRLESFTSRVSGDGRERPARNEPTRASEPKTSGPAATSPAGGSGTDRPASSVPGEAGEGGTSPAADVTTPSAPTTGEDSAPVESPVDGREQPEPAGVSGPAAPDPEPWNEDEIALRKRLEAGETVVVTLRGAHNRLIRWAEEEDLYRRVDRKTEWGNPFELPGDGDRTTVIANYAAHYLPHKPSLLSKVHALRGKALGCWCAPEPCHGHVLARFAEAAERNVLIEALDSVVSLATAAPDDFVALITKSRGRDADR